jgi:hypothetical protein
MGRFDALKENTVPSSERTISRDTVDRRQNNDRNRIGSRVGSIDGNKEKRKELVDNSSNRSIETKIEGAIIKKENFPEMPTAEPPPPPPPPQAKESCWLQAIKKREEEDKKNADLINQSDPKYWRGVNWIGPMLVRQKKFPNSWYPYVGIRTESDTSVNTNAKSQASSFIFPHGDTEYSRDGKRWYKSWDETFSSEQLFRIKYEEEETELYEIVNNMSEYYTMLENESNKYFEEYGKLDDLAIAKLDRIEYENYAEKNIYDEEYDEPDEDVDTEYMSD